MSGGVSLCSGVAVPLLLLLHIKSINYGDAKQLSREAFFFEDTDPFFDSPTTSKPSFEEAVERFFGIKEEERFFRKENDLFDKMKHDEAFFFKEEKKTEIQQEITKIQKEIQVKEPTEVTQRSHFCSCEDVYCTCCSSIKLFGKEKFRGCLEIEYVSRDFAMFMTLSINGHIIVTRVLSGRNPLPFCASTAYIPLVSFCIRLYDIHHNPKGLSLCIRLEATSMRQILFSISFDCIKIDDCKISFYMPPNATTFGVVGFHLGETDPYISYRDWTKLHIPLPDVTPTSTTTVKPKHHFLWFKWN